MPADASRLRQGLAQWAGRVMAQAAPETVAEARRHPRVPRDELELERSITAGPVLSSGNSHRFELKAPVIQAVTTDQGARPHVIRPRRASVLRFPANGRIVFARKVNHPGNPPRPWWRQVVTDAFTKALAAAARRTTF